MALAGALASNSALTDIDLSGNVLGNTGGAALGRAVAANNSLWRLRLVFCNIGEEGAEALLAGFLASSTLASVDLTANKYSEATHPGSHAAGCGGSSTEATAGSQWWRHDDGAAVAWRRG